jgi:hypothetical protein
MLCAVLVASGVALRHVEDVLQECIVGAWRAVQVGRFRPNPSTPLRTALRSWLSGTAWRQAAHFRERASQRYELPFADPVGTLDDQAGADPHDQLAARDALRALAVLPARYRDVLTAFTLGQEIANYARENAIASPLTKIDPPLFTKTDPPLAGAHARVPWRGPSLLAYRGCGRARARQGSASPPAPRLRP